MNLESLTTGGGLLAGAMTALTVVIKYHYRLQMRLLDTKEGNTKRAIHGLDALVKELSDRLDKNEESEHKARSQLASRINMLEKTLLETQGAMIANAKDLTKAYQQFAQAVGKMVTVHKEIRPDLYRVSEEIKKEEK